MAESEGVALASVRKQPGKQLDEHWAGSPRAQHLCISAGKFVQIRIPDLGTRVPSPGTNPRTISRLVRGFVFQSLLLFFTSTFRIVEVSGHKKAPASFPAGAEAEGLD